MPPAPITEGACGEAIASGNALEASKHDGRPRLTLGATSEAAFPTHGGATCWLPMRPGGRMR